MDIEHYTVRELKIVRKLSVKCNKVKTEILWGVLMPWTDSEASWYFSH